MNAAIRCIFLGGGELGAANLRRRTNVPAISCSIYIGGLQPMKKQPGKKKPELFVESMCRQFAPIERKTMRVLGKNRARFFVHVYMDCMEIVFAINDAYSPDSRMNLVFYAVLGLMKEVQWFNFLFVAGNYPLLKARLRFNWEMVFRAHFIETYKQTDPKKPPTPGSTIDEKLDWWERNEKHLNWSKCLEPTLRKVFPLADREQEVRDHYRERLVELHRYAHPSAYLADRLLGDSVLHVKDNFDKDWAISTLDTASVVFDLIWLAVLGFHQAAGDIICGKGLMAHYPAVGGIVNSSKR